MGSANQTCCLTNTAITKGDRCVVIVLNPKTFWNLYTMTSAVFTQNQREDKFSLKDWELKQIINSDRKIGDYLPIKDVLIGTYNDYNSINEIDKNDNELMYYTKQFYHVWAIEFLFGKPIDELLKDKIKMVFDLYIEFKGLRKSPFDIYLVGKQESDIEEVESMLRLNEKINEFLRERLEFFKKRLQD